MPTGPVYFVDLNNYEVIKINDHYSDVKAHPEKYRLTADDITPERSETLEKVLRKGFGRVRHILADLLISPLRRLVVMTTCLRHCWHMQN